SGGGLSVDDVLGYAKGLREGDTSLPGWLRERLWEAARSDLAKTYENRFGFEESLAGKQQEINALLDGVIAQRMNQVLDDRLVEGGRRNFLDTFKAVRTGSGTEIDRVAAQAKWDGQVAHAREGVGGLLEWEAGRSRVLGEAEARIRAVHQEYAGDRAVPSGVL